MEGDVSLGSMERIMENEDYEEGCPKSLTREQVKKILDQADKCVYKIKCDDGGIGTGFFCKIPFPDT